MKIAIASVQVPFTKGGAEYHSNNLKNELEKRGYEADIVTIPFKWYPASVLIDSILTARMIDLNEVNGNTIDRVIGLKFPMYCVKHPNKVSWILHQHRQAYELWGTEYGDLEHMENGSHVREIIQNADNKYIRESKHIFANSKTVANRLLKYNSIVAETLYHPPENYEKLYNGESEDYIFYPSRLHEIKRQHLIIEALHYTKTNVKLLLAGTGERVYENRLKALIEKYNLESRVKLLGRISEDEKIRLYANSSMIYNGPYQEDYGYVTLEAFFSGKPLLTHTDSGGPIEFIQNGINGYSVEPDATLLAEKIDYIYNNKGLSKKMGLNGHQLMQQLGIDWDHVIERLVQ